MDVYIVIETDRDHNSLVVGIYSIQELAKERAKEITRKIRNETLVIQWRLNEGRIAQWSYEVDKEECYYIYPIK